MKKLLSNCLLFLGVLSLGYAQLKTGATVAVTQTQSGKVRGYIHNDIFTYKGIPYAEAKRFEAPQKPKAWEGIRSTMTWGPVAPLLSPASVSAAADEAEFVFDHDWGYSGENCLVLNVWTSGIDDWKKRPVFFWIHGGGYVAGSSQELPSYDGENLAKKGDMVVVSINHRLNILGFLDLSAYGEAYQYSANHSILDIRMALEWVRDNISNFGGDPENVTIAGQSGGGAKVNNLMAMPSAKGLFHKAVNQSGAFRSSILERETTQAITEEVLKELKIKPKNIEQLKGLPFPTLAEAGQKALKTVEARMRAEGKDVPGFGLNWGPSVDGDLMPFQMLSEEALELSKNIPLMIGTVKNEFMPSLRSGLSFAGETEVINVIRNQYKEKTDAFLAAAKEAYPDYRLASDLIDIDVIFRPGAIYQANEKSALKGGAPVYMYLFSWQSPVMDGKYKAIHCMELPFVFDNIGRCANMTGGGIDAHVLAHKTSLAWINFARFGDPNHSGLPKWEAYSEENGNTLFFDNHCHIRHHHDQAFMKLLGLLK